ncbi:PRK06851 family protein [Desulfitobacterium metallireducens]|uniref:ATPase n=1 Tax=Desulfitobacterium metallireducens DSM 15288 TaxID=871968 RepID=W0ECK7_9FIRM|nr:PRK06851 family protein [Desulfitobacterium metallireducens]AHF06939.1 hypothetical protein DESME_07545 [Desulfitobacterium metallireducens DSM 15288]
MTEKAKIRKMFPGGITYQGFYSFYNYMIERDARHIFVIKGGPGVGKSTFMKKIAQSMFEAGYEIEYHCCSSDNNSIDGLVIPELNIALLDGTAPHIVDPKTPGAVDEIINLGEYWNEAKMLESKAEIMACNLQVSRYFQAAYYSLKDAKNAMDEWEFYIEPYQNWDDINKMYLKTEKNIFKNSPPGNGKARHLFAWAHTPQGKCQYIDSLLSGMQTLYTLKGQPGTGKSTFLSRISNRASMLGLSVEYFHSTLDPEKLDLILLPEIKVGLVIDADPYSYTPDFKCTVIELDFDKSLDQILLQNYKSELTSCSERVNTSLERALANSKKAKMSHDQMETYYIPAMDFQAIEDKRVETLQRILNMAEEHSIAVTTNLSPTPKI